MKKKIYMANVTAETNEIIRRAEYVLSQGGEYIMVDLLTVGFAVLQSLRGVDAIMIGISLKEYAKDHKELATVLEMWKI